MTGYALNTSPNASLVSEDQQAHLDIDGLIGADVASIFVRHDHQQRTAP
jgi:hypothetical protein